VSDKSKSKPKRKRDYGEEYKYHKTKKEKLRRAHRNRARSDMEKKVGKAKLKGKDVAHKDNNPLNNSKKNLAIQSKAKNRARKGTRGRKG
jgi:hypothetical protein